MYYHHMYYFFYENSQFSAINTQSITIYHPPTLVTVNILLPFQLFEYSLPIPTKRVWQSLLSARVFELAQRYIPVMDFMKVQIICGLYGEWCRIIAQT